MGEKSPLDTPYPEPDFFDDNGHGFFTLSTLARQMGVTEEELEAIAEEMMRMENCDLY